MFLYHMLPSKVPIDNFSQYLIFLIKSMFINMIAAMASNRYEGDTSFPEVENKFVGISREVADEMDFFVYKRVAK